MVGVNVVVIAGTVAADPITRAMPSGDLVTEIRVAVPDRPRSTLPLPVAAWHGTVDDDVVLAIVRGDEVLVHGRLVRRFYRSGTGARSLTEIVASGIRRLDPTSEGDPAGG